MIEVVVWLCDVDVQLTLCLVTHPYCPCVVAQPVYFARPSIEFFAPFYWSRHNKDKLFSTNWPWYDFIEFAQYTLPFLNFSARVLLENGISGWIRFVTKLQLLPKVYRLFGFNLYLSIPLALNYVHVCGIYIIHGAMCWLCGFVKFVNVLITVKIVSLDFVWVK